MEGLAITPDGRMLVGIMQNALLQDHGFVLGDASARRLQQPHPDHRPGDGETHEFVYVVDV